MYTHICIHIYVTMCDKATTAYAVPQIRAPVLHAPGNVREGFAAARCHFQLESQAVGKVPSAQSSSDCTSGSNLGLIWFHGDNNGIIMG